jgi:hypothetical protein
MRHAPKWNAPEIRESDLGSSQMKLSATKQTAKTGDDFEIDQLWRCEALASQSSPCDIAVVAVLRNAGNDHSGVNDYHGLPAGFP